MEPLARLFVETLARFVEADRFLEAAPPLVATRAQAPRLLPVCGALADLRVLAAPAMVALVDALAEAAPSLEWRQTYSAEDFGEDFLLRYGWTELIGLRGPIQSTGLAAGFLLLGAGVEYPAHAHEAEELYLPLAGRASWMRGKEPFVERIPGEPIFHAAWTPHAMRTFREPLLAAYLWRGGDLAAKSKILGR
jgi:mannose-6-phosphate isomerase-like protein (cupin superfamily)